MPGRSDRYYQIPFGMHWSEVTASSFMEVGIDDGEVKRGEGDVERSCYCIHAPIHKALPQAKAVFHTHMPYASALTRLEDPRIKEIGQTEVGLMNEIAYDDEYTGPALDPAEGARLARVIGDKSVLFMANHGISTVGATVADAYDRLYYIERAAQVQVYAMWTGQPLKQLPDAVVEKTKRDIGGSSMFDGPKRATAALRCAEAHAGPQGAGLRGVGKNSIVVPANAGPIATGVRCRRGSSATSQKRQTSRYGSRRSPRTTLTSSSADLPAHPSLLHAALFSMDCRVSPAMTKGLCHEGCYWLAHTIRAIHSTSLVASVRSTWFGLSDCSSSVLAVRRFNSLTITSPSVVFTTTRSPRRIGVPGDTTMTSPSR